MPKARPPLCLRLPGESRPVRVEVGDEVPAGSHNNDGLLAVRVTSGSDDSTPARIARMTANAQVGKCGWFKCG